VFLSGGRALATATAFEDVVIWDLNSINDVRAHAIDEACARVGRGLDPAEWSHYISGLPYQDTCPR
jgi:hypothetical protein